jgi:hypothetical protein
MVLLYTILAPFNGHEKDKSRSKGTKQGWLALALGQSYICEMELDFGVLSRYLVGLLGFESEKKPSIFSRGFLF